MTRRSTLIWGAVLLTAAAALGLLVASMQETTAADQWWNDLLDDFRSPAVIAFSEAMDWVGGGIVAILVIPLLLALFLMLRRGWRCAVFSLVALTASSLLVQAWKQAFGRARPEDILVIADYGSYPSGHTANAATIAIVLWLVFPRVLTAVIGAFGVVLMAASRTLISAHWITDVLGGALVGAGAGLLIAAALFTWLPRESPDQSGE